MYIAAKGSGGFGSSPNSHIKGGPRAVVFSGSVNSDIKDGKIKVDAPPAQLYDLNADVEQTTNLYLEYPEVVKEMEEILETYIPKKERRFRK